MKINRIQVTGDFLRVNGEGESDQTVNVYWLYNLLRPVLNIALPALPVNLFWNEWKTSAEMPGAPFYAAAGEKPCQKAWIKLADGAPVPRQLAWIEDRFAGSLVIGFELPNIVVQGLTRLGIPYIDFTIHPARFMRDLALGARSNVADLGEAFAPWSLPDEIIAIEAGFAMSKSARLGRPQICNLAEDIAIFACQTIADRVLIRNGEFIQIMEFGEELQQISRRHELILVKPHPLGRNPESELALLQFLPNAMLAQDNIYLLLSQPSVKAVYSINSSASIEARYFDKSGFTLANYPLKFSPETMSEDTYFTFWEGLEQPELWQRIGACLSLPTRNGALKVSKLNLRENMGSWWAADLLYRRR